MADQRAETGTNGGTEPGVTDDEEARRHYAEKISPFVERFAADLTEAGMQRMASRVFACLLASEEGALTSAELSERLQASPAAISGAVRYLAQVNMISLSSAIPAPGASAICCTTTSGTAPCSTATTS